MMTERILVLAAADREALGRVRHLPGLQVAEAAGQLWLRGLPATAELPLPVRGLPAVAAYAVDSEVRLFAGGQRTPTARLPAGLSWQPIRAFVPLELPTAALPAQGAPAYRVRLGASARAEAGAGLLTDLATWHAYAETAPEIRLRALRFAVAADGRVLLLGVPLPPLPGQELWWRAGLLLPAGFDFEAPLLAPLLRQKLQTAADDVLLFAADGRWERIPAAAVLPVTRSAVRFTMEGFGDE
ncbi:hypothetical protein MON38_10510 [Hymenobacter sp. DH14]|uniref:MoxR-vWA-beta-propeller ternary system domain-containing protein n=1 Tax=Hymenobacter cyanobacteriorum TaxID=2926463 RepID=A0A9X2AFH1_9BACT|nr:hypothetical protein [Hymenobacter cyanobacteriorum]MCI1187852.1 hypothetical protein [Hymenobacter cyanobacteriorum]